MGSQSRISYLPGSWRLTIALLNPDFGDLDPEEITQGTLTRSAFVV
jgi:hypothetical protein